MNQSASEKRSKQVLAASYRSCFLSIKTWVKNLIEICFDVACVIQYCLSLCRFVCHFGGKKGKVVDLSWHQSVSIITATLLSRRQVIVAVTQTGPFGDGDNCTLGLTFRFISPHYKSWNCWGSVYFSWLIFQRLKMVNCCISVMVKLSCDVVIFFYNRQLISSYQVLQFATYHGRAKF